MSRSLKYEDLHASEQLQYQELLSTLQQTDDRREPLQATARPREASVSGNTLASVRGLYDYVKMLFERYRGQPRATPVWSDLERFIRVQASKRGCDTFERASFPGFPAGLDPFKAIPAQDQESVEHAYPEALHRIIETFRDASPAQRLDMLLVYAGDLPALPEALQGARDTMEQVDECQIPVFLRAQLRDGKVYYDIDVPQDAPTMRGFAGILHAGLNGAPPEAIAATPDDLCQQLGLHKALAPLRLRGLTALLRRVKQNARALATPV